MATAKRKPLGRLIAGEAPTEPRCEWPGCGCPADYRAPYSRQRLHLQRWFCLEHVRRYNAGWNYYAGMSEEEIEADLRLDTVWRRPTWRVGSNGFRPDDFDDPLGILGNAEPAPAKRRPASPEERAMDLLELRPPLTIAVLRTRYRELVKRHHPDANAGDKAAEEKFKEIQQAYHTLLKSLAA